MALERLLDSAQSHGTQNPFTCEGVYIAQGDSDRKQRYEEA